MFMIALLLAGCAGLAAPAAPPPTLPPSVTPSLTPFVPPTETPVPTPTATPEPTATAQPAAPVRPKYVIELLLDYAGRSAQVIESISYPNLTGQTLTGLVLAVEANLYPSAFHLETLQVDGVPVEEYTLSHQQLDLPLPFPLAPGNSVSLLFVYRLDLPWVDINVDPDRRGNIFGWTSRQVNLVEWYPFVVPFENGGWLLHRPWSYGEWLAYDAADFDVSLRLHPAREDLIVAASGAEVAPGRYRLDGGRTFAISLSPDFEVAEVQVGGVPVRSYYFPEHAAAGQAVLDTTAMAVALYSARFAPYPYGSLSAVEGQHCESMEYSGFYFINRDLYSQYAGIPNDFLIVITAHETAHQWWFGLVGNDQAAAPWLDEALSTYSERLFYEAVYPEIQDSWWWEYRLARYDLEGWVDTTLYDSDRIYRYAVYLRGALFLHRLREQIGDPAFFAFLADYAARNSYERATTSEFFDILAGHTDVDLSALRELYFHTLP